MNHKIRRLVIIAGLIFLGLQIPAITAATVVKVAVANMHVSPSEEASLASQAIYGSQIKILSSKGSWYLVSTDDNYQGWIKKTDLAEYQIPANASAAQVKSLFAFVYVNPTTIETLPIIALPSGAKIPIIKANNDHWLQIQLANGKLAWIQEYDVTIDPQPMTMHEMLSYSRNFIGLPYLWGGVSTYGFDCSGFVQFLFRYLGIVLPRDTNLTVNSHDLFEVPKTALKPGDILFFGFDHKISHEGLYLGNNTMINATAYGPPIVQISNLSNPHWQAMYITARRLIANPENIPEFKGSIEPISDEMKQKMLGTTWHEGCPVAPEQLSAVSVSYVGFDEKTHDGTLIVNSRIAQEVLDIFAELYAARFPIEKIHPIEEYSGNDQRSMADDNTSAFNCRAMTDFKGQFSIHSYGYAIDINPLINPYVNGQNIEPASGAVNVDRKTYHKGKINHRSVIIQIFAKHGWIWGGSWAELKDYQHFEKTMKN